MLIPYLGHSDCGQNQFELFKKGLGMDSSIKMLPNPDDLEDSVLTKAEKLCVVSSIATITV